MINKLLREGLLNEIRFGISELPQNTALFNNNHSLTLYNFDYLEHDNPLEGVLGYISMLFDGNYGSVDQVAAKKGYGPFMYELAIQYVSPSGLQSSRDGNTNGKAIRIWEYLINKPNEFNTKTLKPNDNGYLECNEMGCVEDKPNLFKLINTAIYSKDTEDLNILMSDGDDLIDGDYDISSLINGYGHDFFDKMY